MVVTGAFFAVVFHIGTREPSAKKGEQTEVCYRMGCYL